MVATVGFISVLLPAVLAAGGWKHDVWRLFLVGFALAFITWLASFIAFATARRAGDVGALVPAMLMLVTAFVCFPMTVIFIGFNEGALC